MNFVFILICLIVNVNAGEKTFDKHKLEALLKRQQLWGKRQLTQDQMNYYIHRTGAIVDEADLKRHSVPPQSRIQLNRKMNHATVTLPDRFDARTDARWVNCQDVVSEIQDQSRCDNCWAIATAAVMSDRACIATNGASKPRISAYDLTRCCDKCQIVKGDGCKSGIAAYAFDHFSEFGVVTGGLHDSKEGCLPYPFPPTTQPISHSAGACDATCSDSKLDYEKERHYGMGDYYNPVGEDEMKKEIYLYGPIAVSIEFHKELTTFHADPTRTEPKSIYHIITRDFNDTHGTKSYHAVRILGWDYETMSDGTDVPYWIIANSWGKAWGEGGTFKYVRTLRHGKVEDYAVSGLYDYEKSPKKDCKRLNCNIL